MTSHDVVAMVRRLAGLRQVGHTGTLDPDASGVLIICLGRSTRLARFFEALEKTYWVVMQLGVRTDTQDATGVVMERARVPEISRADLTAVLRQFTGPQQQIPPMYSAVKYHGQRLYRLARQGHTITRQARAVFIRRCDLLDARGAWITFAVTCSKGTYVRTLCDDIGLILGCGAQLVHLQRCQIGPFRLSQACTLQLLQQRAYAGVFDQLIIPAAEALHFLPGLTLTTQQYDALQRGQRGVLPTLLPSPAPPLPPASCYRLYAPAHGTFAVMYKPTPTAEQWKLYYLEDHEAGFGALSHASI
jgi:tRNA pseudouridine55 synthase